MRMTADRRRSGRWTTAALIAAGLAAASTVLPACGGSSEIRVTRNSPINDPPDPGGPSGTRAGGPRAGEGAPFSR